jgi:hypothetical protein
VLGGEDVGFFAKNVIKELFQIQIFEYPVIWKSIQLQEEISRAATHSSTSVFDESRIPLQVALDLEANTLAVEHPSHSWRQLPFFEIL